MIYKSGWIKTTDSLPSISDADDAGLVYQCEETPNGFRYLSNIHIELLRMDRELKSLTGREYWHPKQKAPKLPTGGSYENV